MTSPRLGARIEAVVFDWDGTAVPDRAADATEVRLLVEELCAAGADVAVVSGTHVGNVDGQLRARPHGPGRLLLALNRGSEVFAVDESGPTLAYRRDATNEEEGALERAAALAVARLADRGLTTKIVSRRLNRRKIDVIPIPAWADPPKARIDALLEAVQQRVRDAGLSGLLEVVDIATEAARDAGLSDPRVTSDAKHVEIGLTDKSDSARWLLRYLWSRGIGPSLVLFAGDEFGDLGGLPGSDSLMLVDGSRTATAVSVGREPSGVPHGVRHVPGGPHSFIELLREQVTLRAGREPPRVDEQPAWTIAVEGVDPERERADEVRLTLSDGRVATSGAPLLLHENAAARVLAAGVYDGEGPETELLQAPPWHRFAAELPDAPVLRRVLDLHTGVMHEELAGRVHVRGVRFVSGGVSPLGILRATATGLPVASALEPFGAGGPHIDAGRLDNRPWMRVTGTDGGIAAAVSQDVQSLRSSTMFVDRFVAFDATSAGEPSVERAMARVSAQRDRGFDECLVEHRAKWAQRWEGSDIEIVGDDRLQQAVRFALYHLQMAAAAGDEAAVGARGLTGRGYRGHVFWDADVFVLPFLAATEPTEARAMLEYRARRLPAAHATAQSQGRAGARFPWESARSGRDVTPRSARDRAGNVVAIRTGALEDHIVADVAWAAAYYLDWTGDQEFAAGTGRDLLVETARYWASRIRVAPDGSAHILGVIGPDEYHEPVDDNAFTNVMARWNLRRGAALLGEREASEHDQWLRLADSLVDGYDPETGIYEQFAGFHSLEPLLIADVAPRRPVVADLLLGRDRVRSAQVVKQADALMLHHLVPDEVAPESLVPNLRYYEPRTAHGSSLSPGIHAALFARARDDERALEALDIAARIDLDDLTATTAAGVHLATMGSLWQALALGYAGLRPGNDGVLTMDPRLPA